MRNNKKSSSGRAPAEAETTTPSEEEAAPAEVVEESAESDESRLAKLLSSDLLKGITKQHGKAILTRATESRVRACPRIPTGIFELDYALGGGVPAGRVNIAYGLKSSGKTTVVARTIGQAQKMCANCYSFLDAKGRCSCRNFREHVCAFLDVEGTWDNDWAGLHGVATDQVLLSRPEYAEQTLDIAEALIRSQQVDLLAIDSIAFLTPAKEIEESTEKALQAEQARALGRGVRKFVAAINWVGNKTGRRPTLIFTNQVRHKIGVMFGSPETTPGGFAPGFAASTEMRCWSGKYEMNDMTGQPISVELNFRVEKNKVSGAHMEGKYHVILSNTPQKKKGEIYDEPEIVEFALKIGLLEKISNNDWKILGESFRGKSLIVQRMCEDVTYKKTVTEAMLRILVPA